VSVLLWIVLSVLWRYKKEPIGIALTVVSIDGQKTYFFIFLKQLFCLLEMKVALV